jgi:hypothetical protein
MWSSCGSMHRTCLTGRVIRTLRKSVLERKAKESHTQATSRYVQYLEP